LKHADKKMKNLTLRFQSANPTHLWLLSGIALAISPHVIHLPLTVILFGYLLLGWRLAVDLKYMRLPGRLLRLVLTLVAMVITFESFHTLFGRQAGIGLLVAMLCLKLMEMKQDRDVIVVIGLGYFAVVTVFLFNQSMFIGLYMVIVVILLTTALTSHNREHSKVHQFQNLKLAGILLLQATPLMLLLFILFPRIPGPLWSLPNDSVGAKTGISDSMSPGKISNLSNNDAVAFRVQFHDKIPPKRELYWRGPVLNYFDGQTWTASGVVQYEAPGEKLADNTSYFALGEPTHYTVTLEPNNQKWLFALDMIAQLPQGSNLSPDYVITTRNPIEQLLRYRIQSYTHYQLDPQYEPNRGKYLQLPNTLTPRIKQLVIQWRKDANGDMEKIVDLALQHFSEQPFYYTRKPPLLFNNPVDEFLFDTRRGFCEHYASAFVYLMRASGIPSRVVTGYQGGEKNPLSDYFIVRQSDAHAWAEVWIQGRGWTRVDPTAVIPPERIENQQDLVRIVPDVVVSAPGWTAQLMRKVGYSWDNLNHFWNQWVLNYNNQRQLHLMSRLMSWFGLPDIDWKGMVMLMMAGMSLVFGFFAFKLLKAEAGRSDPVVSAYQAYCRKLARRGIDKNPEEGASDFAKRVLEQYPNFEPAVSYITSLYQRLRYAKNPPQDGIRKLRTAVKKFRPMKNTQITSNS